MLKTIFFTPSKTDTRKFDNFVKKMGGDVQQSAGGGAMFHVGSGFRYHIGVISDEIASSAAKRRLPRNDKKSPNNNRKKLVATMTLYARQLPFGLSWLYCPRGPLWEKPQKDVWNALCAKIRDIARREQAIFLRIEPDEKEQLDISATDYIPNPHHPWAGISDFKLKFGGSIFRYHPAVEYIFSPFWYFIFLTIKNIKKNFQRHADSQKNTSKDISPFWKNCRFKRAHAHYQPEYTNMVDLSLPEAEILAQMKPKGRYNIRLAEKKGAKIVSCLKASDAANIFYQLFQETTHRDKFSGHNKTFYENILKIGGELGIAKLYIAYSVIPDRKSSAAVALDASDQEPHPEHSDPQGQSTLSTEQTTAPDQESLQTIKNPIDPRSEAPSTKSGAGLSVEDDSKPIAAIIVTSFGNRATYFYGASSNTHRDLMAPYLLQWTAMLDAKKEGQKWYDLFGIAPQE